MPLERTYSEDLITNALSNVTDGLQDFDAHDGPKLKRALGLVFGGTLLLLKERIRRVNPEAIYTKPDHSQTLNFDGCLRSLRKVAGVELDNDQLQTLRSAQLMRNRIEHNEFTFEIAAVLQLLDKLAAFVYRFMRDELAIDLMTRIDAYTAHRLRDVAEIVSRLDQDFLAEWGRRAAPYFELSDEQLNTLREGDGEPYHPKHNPDPEELYECRECGNYSVHHEWPDIAICTDLDCREVYALHDCEKCGSRALNGGEFCEDCLGDMERHADD